MSCEASSGVSFDTLLAAIEAVKAEVSELASGLKSAEARIERIEAFTFFTPPESPIISPQSSRDVQHPVITDQSAQNGKAKDLDPIEKIIRSSIEEAFNKKENEAMKEPENSPPIERASDIQQHLEPINAGIETIAKHLERIELSIGLINKNITPSPSVPVGISLQESPVSETVTKESASSKEATEPTLRPRSSLPTPLNSSKIRGRSPAAPSPPSIPSELPRLVFGQTATPSKRRPVSMNVAGSPFGSYADERSPFSHLASQRSRPSSALSNAEHSISPVDIQDVAGDGKGRVDRMHRN